MARQFMESFCRIDALVSLNRKIQSGKGKVSALSPTVSLADLYRKIRRIKLLIPGETLLPPEGPIPFIFDQRSYKFAENTPIFSNNIDDFSQARLLCSAGLLDESCFHKKHKIPQQFLWVPDTLLHKLNHIKKGDLKTEKKTEKKNSAASVKSFSQAGNASKINQGGAYKGDFVNLRQYVGQFIFRGLEEALVLPRLPPAFDFFLWKDLSNISVEILTKLAEVRLDYPRVLDFLVDRSTPLPRELRALPVPTKDVPMTTEQKTDRKSVV